MARTADGCVLFCLIILIASLKLSKGVSFFIDEQDFGKVKQLSCGTGENFGTVTWLSKNVKDREWKPTSYEGNDVQLVPETSTLEVTITEDTLLGYQCRSDDTNETIITYWLLTQELRMDVTTSFKPNSNKELCVTVTYCRDLIESENPSNVELYVNGSLSNQGMMRNGKASFSILLQPYEQYNISFIVATSNGRIQSKIVTLNATTPDDPQFTETPPSATESIPPRVIPVVIAVLLFLFWLSGGIGCCLLRSHRNKRKKKQTANPPVTPPANPPVPQPANPPVPPPANPPVPLPANPPVSPPANSPVPPPANPPVPQPTNPPVPSPANPPVPPPANPPVSPPANPPVSPPANPPVLQSANPPAIHDVITSFLPLSLLSGEQEEYNSTTSESLAAPIEEVGGPLECTQLQESGGSGKESDALATQCTISKSALKYSVTQRKDGVDESSNIISEVNPLTDLSITHTCVNEDGVAVRSRHVTPANSQGDTVITLTDENSERTAEIVGFQTSRL